MLLAWLMAETLGGRIWGNVVGRDGAVLNIPVGCGQRACARTPEKIRSSNPDEPGSPPHSRAAPVSSPFRQAIALLVFPSLLASQATSVPSLVPTVSLPGASPILFAQVQDAVPTADGGVLVLDLGNHALYRFDAAGRFLDSLGRRGRGPGEFQVPDGLVRTADGGMGVLDISLSSVLWWNRQGRHESQTSLPADWAPVDLRGGDGNVAWIKSQRYRENQVVFGNVRLGRAYVDSTTRITTLAGPPSEEEAELPAPSARGHPGQAVG